MHCVAELECGHNQLADNIASGLMHASESAQQRMLLQYKKADPDYAARVSVRLKTSKLDSLLEQGGPGRRKAAGSRQTESSFQIALTMSAKSVRTSAATAFS
jgi:hypothetical protein